MKAEINWIEYAKREFFAEYKQAKLRVGWFQLKEYSWSVSVDGMSFMFGFADNIELAKTKAIESAKNALNN